MEDGLEVNTERHNNIFIETKTSINHEDHRNVKKKYETLARLMK